MTTPANISKHTRLSRLSDQGREASTLLRVGSKGIDRDQLAKLASDGGFPDIKPEKGCAFLLVVTTGSGEAYGPNTNFDYYHERPKSVSFCRPVGAPTMMLGPGLYDRHETFLKFGGVYRNHHNKRDTGAAPLGEVVWQRINEPMHWGEVIVKLPLAEWSTDIERHERGEPLLWSQGSDCPMDVCSRCGFQFTGKVFREKGFAGRCDCMKMHPLELDESGRQISAYAINPEFHDISEVGDNPAAKYAFCLRKVAAEGYKAGCGAARLFSPELSDVRMVHASPEKRSREMVARRLADAETTLDVDPELEDSFVGAFEIPPAALEAARRGCDGVHPRDLLAAASHRRVLMTPRVFSAILISREPGTPTGVAGMRREMSRCYRNLVAEGFPQDVMDDASYMPCGGTATHEALAAVDRMAPFLSILPSEAMARSRSAASRPGTRTLLVAKLAASAEPTPATRLLAREYAKYQLQFLATGSDPREDALAAAANRVA